MQVLLLNNTYEPLKIISWQKAIILFFKQKVDIIEEYENKLLHSERIIFKMPAVVRLNKYVNIRKYQNLRFTKENIFFRDNYCCVYCGKRYQKDQLTLDHVIPLSKGGKKTWNNIVTACNHCNNKKGDQLIDQMGIKLLKKPDAPPTHTYIHFYIKLQTIPHQWKVYLPSTA